MADLSISSAIFLRSATTWALPRHPDLSPEVDVVEVDVNMNAEVEQLASQIFLGNDPSLKLEKIDKKTEELRCVAAVADGRMVGCASMKRQKPARFLRWRSMTADLFEVGVDSDFRRRKIGSHLLHAAISAMMRDWKVNTCRLAVASGNRAAQNLYRKFGFVYTGRRGIIGMGLERFLADEMRVTNMRDTSYKQFVSEMKFDRSC